MPESSESSGHPPTSRPDVVAEVDGEMPREASPGEAEGVEGAEAGRAGRNGGGAPRTDAGREGRGPCGACGSRSCACRPTSRTTSGASRNSFDDEKIRAREGIIGSLLPRARQLRAGPAGLGKRGQTPQGLIEGVPVDPAPGTGHPVARGSHRDRGRRADLRSCGCTRPSCARTATTVEDQTIMLTLQKGYRLGTRVLLRPSMVKVAVNTRCR